MHGLAPFLVRNADNGGLRDSRMARQRVLHLGRIDVLAAADDHVLEAVDQEDKAFFVHVAAVAGMHPAIADGLGGGFRLVPVSKHDVGSAHHDLPGRTPWDFAVLLVDDTNFDRCRSAADRANASILDIGRTMMARQQHGTHWCKLGHAVTLHELN
ncbi:hypothetical protein D3C81_1022770 [compost metagenome]